MTTFADRIAARLARYDSPDDRRLAALAAIEVAVDGRYGILDTERVADVRAVLAALQEASRPVGVSPGADLAIDPDPCLFSWGGCEETYHGGHECHRSGAHKGRHQCLCGATSVRQQEDKASRPVS